MQLGRLDFCLRVASVEVSRTFYEKLGFHRVEGKDAEGWAVMVHGHSRLGLFEAKYMSNSLSLNFRGGHIEEIVQELSENGIELLKAPVFKEKGAGSASLCDPDGNLIFLDSSTEERSNS